MEINPIVNTSCAWFLSQRFLCKDCATVDLKIRPRNRRLKLHQIYSDVWQIKPELSLALKETHLYSQTSRI